MPAAFVQEKAEPVSDSTSADHSVYRAWLDQDARWLITPAERTAFLALTSDWERDDFIQHFWERKGSDAGMSADEYKAEIYARIAYANENFASGQPGWMTDRGHVYIVYGKPDEIDTQPGYGTQIWRYRSTLRVLGDNVVLKFADASGKGDYRLATPMPQKKSAATPSGAVVAAPSFEVTSVRMVDAHSAAELQRGIGLFSGSVEHLAPRRTSSSTALLWISCIGIAYGILDEARIRRTRGWMDSQLYDKTIDARVQERSAAQPG